MEPNIPYFFNEDRKIRAEDGELRLDKRALRWEDGEWRIYNSKLGVKDYGMRIGTQDLII